MVFERLVGLHVSNEEIYGQYREHMMPILKKYGGYFAYDFKIAEVLKSEVDEAINRVFIIAFKSESDSDAFFNDANYLEVKEQYFSVSVSSATIISAYEK